MPLAAVLTTRGRSNSGELAFFEVCLPKEFVGILVGIGGASCPEKTVKSGLLRVVRFRP